MKQKHAVQAKVLLDAAFLRKVDLFKGLPNSRLQTIEAQSETQEFPAGHYFFRTGEVGHRLFLLEKGEVQTFRISETKKLIIADLKPPAVFGEMGCIGRRLYHCCAQATEPSRVHLLSQAVLDSLLDEYPAVSRRLLDVVSGRFVDVLLDLDATSFQLLIPLMAKFLLERANGELIRDLTHKDLAQHLRVYRESATAALGELKKAGIIDVERKRIRILNRPRLERAARE